MPVFHHYKCIFVHITKTGGTSIESAFNVPFNDKNENREFMYGDIISEDLKQKKLSSPALQHLTIMELKELLDPDVFNNYFKFAIVRNPWDRVLSEYFFDRNAYRKKNPISFEDFVKNLNYFHRYDQMSFISDNEGKILVDYVGKYENLKKDFIYICKKIGIKKITLSAVNITRHRHYSTYYTEELREIVGNIYKRDIETFNYTFESNSIINECKRFFINTLSIRNIIKRI